MSASAGRKRQGKVVPSCPVCHSSEHVVQIVYGFQADELLKSDRADFVLGGCAMSEDSPGWFCQECDESFGEACSFAESE